MKKNPSRKAGGSKTGSSSSAPRAASKPAPIGPSPLTARPKPPLPAARRAKAAADDNSITDVNTLPVVSPAVAAKIKAAAGLGSKPALAARAAKAAPSPAGTGERAAASRQPPGDHPGTERWRVKTGQDPDRVKVGKNLINGEDLGAGIVETTIDELISLPRPQGLEDIKADPPEFSNVRDGVAEVTIWRVEGEIVALKHEKDGDYHLVMRSASGEEMVAEIPTPTSEFVGDSPWIDNIQQARQQVDDKLVRHLAPAAFGVVNGKYRPHGSTTFAPSEAAAPGLSFTTPPEGSGLTQPLFQTAITPTSARITGIGFFDREHGQLGAAPNVIELHTVLKVEWL